MMVMQFGQFVDHDIAHVPFNEELDCCSFKEWYNGKEIDNCFTIHIPSADSFSKGQMKCQNFVRSNCAPRLDCSPGPAEQVNQITSWLDSSNVYGSEYEENRNLRYGSQYVCSNVYLQYNTVVIRT